MKKKHIDDEHVLKFTDEIKKWLEYYEIDLQWEEYEDGKTELNAWIPHILIADFFKVIKYEEFINSNQHISVLVLVDFVFFNLRNLFSEKDLKKAFPN
ncbi:MAG: hypothetical protein ACRCZB_04925 [Bacteroidales bacterium]